MAAPVWLLSTIESPTPETPTGQVLEGIQPHCGALYRSNVLEGLLADDGRSFDHVQAASYASWTTQNA